MTKKITRRNRKADRELPAGASSACRQYICQWIDLQIRYILSLPQNRVKAMGRQSKKPMDRNVTTMPSLLTNQLSFFSNTKNILNLIKSRFPASDASPHQFSLESIRPMPESLRMPHFDAIMPLVALNIDITSFAEIVKHAVIAEWFATPPAKADKATIQKSIEQIGSRLTNKASLELFAQAVANYDQYKFFTQYDWRMDRWGTLADIQTVDASTFHALSRHIVFTSLWTPPIPVLRALAEAFPSVRFELRYRYEESDTWTTEEIFPLRPWGY